MGIIFSLISLVEKNDFSLYKRIILPTAPRAPARHAKTFLSGCVFA